MDNTKNVLINENPLKPFKDMICPIHDGLYKYIHSIVRNKEIAEDVMQTTLLNAYKNINELKDSSKFKTWIFTIAKNEAINIIRKNRREVAVDIIELYESDDNGYAGPEEYIIDSELKDIVAEAINSLNNDERDIIALHYYNGIQFQEIAGMLGINYNTIKTRHRSIKEKIYSYLVDKHYITDNNKEKR